MVCVRSTPAIHFYRYALRSVHACCLPPVRQTERLAECFVPIPPWVVIAIRAFSDVAWLSGFVGSLRACAFSGGDPDGETKGRGERRRRGGRAFLRDRISFAMFSAGSPLGAARPQTCAKESLALWTLFIWVVMWVSFAQRRGLRRNEDLTGFNKRRPPQTAPRRLVSLDSLHLIRDVGAFHAARGARVQRRLDRLQ